MKLANLRMISRRAIGASFFQAGKAFSAAATAISTSSAPALETSLATREPSLGLKTSNFFGFLDETYWNC